MAEPSAFNSSTANALFSDVSTNPNDVSTHLHDVSANSNDSQAPLLPAAVANDENDVTTESGVASQSYDVIIIGAGLGGLNASRVLRERADLRVVVLEARERVGGRTETLRNDESSYKYVDTGGAYIDPGVDRRMLAIIDELGLCTYAAPAVSRDLQSIYHSESISRTTLTRNATETSDVERLHSLLSSMCAQITAAAPWQANQASAWDHVTLENWAVAHAQTQLGRSLVGALAGQIFASLPQQLSLLAVLHVLTSRGGLKAPLSAYGAGEVQVVGGIQQVSDGLAAKCDVRLCNDVTSIDQSNASAVHVTTSSGQSYTASYVIITLPHFLLNRVTFIPSLPRKKQSLTERLVAASVYKTFTFYSRDFWKDLRLSGFMSSDGGPVSRCLEDTKPDGSSPCLVGFVMDSHASGFSLLNPDERKSQVIQQYANVFGSDLFLSPIEYVDKNWASEKYSGGCFPVFGPGVLTGLGVEMKGAVGRVHFAGAEGARECVGHMEGALESGERAAREVMDRLLSEKY